MVTCKECLHFEVCEALEQNGINKVSPIQCGCYKPTADVVPKTEVEKLQKELEIWKQNRFNLFQRLGCYEMAKQKVASEIFEEIEEIRVITSVRQDNVIVYDVRDKYTELKKKYTEGKQ